MVKKMLLALLVVLVAAQFVRPAKNVDPAGPGADDFLQSRSAPAEVQHLMKVGCYDCHSNTTRYPWYAEVQPFGWWLKQHVDDGKRELNLSEFNALPEKKQGKRLEAMIDEISDRVMPLKSYTLTHRDAKFTDAQIKLLTEWLQAERDKLPE